jgi:CHAD domain-containing protein
MPAATAEAGNSRKKESATFLEVALAKNARRARRRLQAYLLDPGSDENVHGMRTSLRRLEAAFSLMPKKARRKNRRQICAYKEFFSANSRVRDCDIMRARIVARGGAGPALLAGLEKKRKARLKRALALGWALAKMPELADLSKKIDKEELAARTDKVVRRLIARAERHRDAAVRDERAKEELHELRKDLKKLRYVLEIVPSRLLADPHRERLARLIEAGAARRASLEPRLKELQDLIGTIHDIDITVNYLRGLKKKERDSGRAESSIIQKETAERDELFEKFAKTFGA